MTCRTDGLALSATSDARATRERFRQQFFGIHVHAGLQCQQARVFGLGLL
jgi:hypothetical protein